jgi:hypothetical protein
MGRVENFEALKEILLREVKALDKPLYTINPLCLVNFWSGYLLNSSLRDHVFNSCVRGGSWIYLYEKLNFYLPNSDSYVFPMALESLLYILIQGPNPKLVDEP